MDQIRQPQGAARYPATASQTWQGGASEHPRERTLSHLMLHLLRAAFLALALYGAGYGHEVYAWIFGILFVHTLLDSRFYLRPNLMEAYLLFTVVFYFHRYVMGWGAAITIFTDDAPNWVKVLKDLVWIALVALVGSRALL